MNDCEPTVSWRGGLLHDLELVLRRLDDARPAGTDPEEVARWALVSADARRAIAELANSRPLQPRANRPWPLRDRARGG